MQKSTAVFSGVAVLCSSVKSFWFAGSLVSRSLEAEGGIPDGGGPRCLLWKRLIRTRRFGFSAWRAA